MGAAAHLDGFPNPYALRLWCPGQYQRRNGLMDDSASTCWGVVVVTMTVEAVAVLVSVEAMVVTLYYLL